MISKDEEVPIDLVYLWVNGNDPVWREKRNRVIGKTEEMSAVNCEGRYADNDELKYSLRSAALYAPWIRRLGWVVGRWGKKSGTVITAH